MELLSVIAVLSIGAIFAYLVGRISRSRSLAGFITFLALAGAGHGVYQIQCRLNEELVPRWPVTGTPMLTSYLRGDALGVFLATVALGLAALVTIYSMRYMHKIGIGKFYALLLLMTTGIVGVGFASDLFSLYVLFEAMSIASFVLVAFERDEWEPIEAGIKYLTISTAGSLMALLGISMVYMYTNSLDLAIIPALLIDRVGTPELLAITALLVVGFGVKAALVPMHTWLPDAHSAAPSGISAMLSGIVIQAGLIAMVKSLIAVRAFDSGLLLPIMAVVTMFVGNLMALRQTDIKRLLAYSSVAQMGYIFMGVGLALGFPTVEGASFDGMRGALYHILNHAIMKGGAFLCAGVLLYLTGTRDLGKLSGIGRRVPLMGWSMLIFALALAGTPPLNGYVSKLLICRAGVEVGGWGVFMVVMLILNSVISLFYYLRAANGILFGAVPEGQKITKSVPFLMAVPVVILVALVFFLGLYPEAGFQLVDPAAEYLNTLITLQ
jgi:proton-translocating NADH-quinone oxidoreductase chain N